MSVDMRIVVARLFGVAAVVCGLIGLAVGVIDKVWKLGVTGWFTGGTLLAVLAIIVLADAYVSVRRAQQ
ncbi:MAG: hypothetical protein IIB33_01480 [Chloroflexi bacterium]|nr:hypothetical protein [Chloroflexota bacterium]